MKRILKQASVIGLFVLAVSIVANAQVDQQYRAEIPFDFDAAGKHYAAGTYAVGPLSSSGAVAIRSMENGKMRVLGLNVIPGNNDWDNPGTLTFQKVGGRHQLRQISTATFKMAVRIPRAKGDLAKKDSSTEVLVSLK